MRCFISCLADCVVELLVLQSYNPVLELADLSSSGSEVIKIFSGSTQLSLKFSLLINMKMPTIVGIFIFLAEKFSCSAMFSKKEFAVDSNFEFISTTNFMLS